MNTDGCKVCGLLEKHDMEQYDDRLVEHWRGPDDERMGYRQLADWFNVTMLRREMDRSGLNTLGNETESKYERLVGDDTAVAEEVRRSLHDEGVPIDDLVEDFVSYGVVRTHLKECLGVEREPTEADTDWERRSIEIAQSNAEGKVMEAVTSLVNKGDLQATSDIEVHLDAEIECHECQLRVPLDRALRRGQVCDCPTQEATVHE